MKKTNNMEKSHMKIKIFQAANHAQLEQEVNRFLHPIKGARIGTMHFDVTVNGMQNVYTCMVSYIELEVDDEKEIQLGDG